MSKDRDRDDGYSRPREGNREESHSARSGHSDDRRSQDSSRKEDGRPSRDDRERGDKRPMSRDDSHRDRRNDDESKKRRHTSRSESESNSQERSSSPERGKEGAPKTLGDRLRAIAGSATGERCGKWLQTEMEHYKKKYKIDDSVDPTDEEIKLHIKLPNPEKISEFKEPLRQWETVESTGIPSWRKDLLPEEEVEKPADWKPPTPPRVDISLISAIQAFEHETPKPPKINEIIADKRVILENNMRDSDEIVLYSGACIVRTTKKGVEQSKKDRENEEREDERQFGGGGFRGGGRGRGDRGRGGGRGRGGDRGGGRGDRDGRWGRGGGGYGNRDDRSFERSRNSSSPGRSSSWKSENDGGWKDERRDRKSSHEDSRPPRRDSYDRRPEVGASSSVSRRSFSPEAQSRGRDERRSKEAGGEGDRKWSGGHGDRGREGDREGIKERRESRGYGDSREENRGGHGHGVDRRDSRGGNEDRERREEPRESMRAPQSASSVPLTYKEYKARKAAEAAARGQ